MIASLQLRTNIAIVIPLSTHVPHTRSSSAHPIMRDRFEQSEVIRALQNPTDFCEVERGSPHWRAKTSGMARDTATDSRPAFVVDDGSYVSARWPGDTHTFADVLSRKL